jgi:UDP:flavonoid glycosyltransferase YjiC (YdhE family)
MRFTRPPILDQLTDPDPRRPPTVYVSLGTVFNLESGDLLRRLVEGMNRFVGDEQIDVTVTTGPHVSAADLPTPRDGVRIADFVPLREVLGGCGAVVCHGGSGTVVAALSLGIPVAVLPMGADQPDNADRCRELGVGVVLDPLTASPDEIAEATRTALRDPALRSNARMLEREAARQPRLEELQELRQLLTD